MSEFAVGMRCVCVNDGPISDPGKSTDFFQKRYGLRKGGIYIIRWVGPYRFDTGTEIGIKLDGILRRMNADKVPSDWPFGASRFRPLEEKSAAMELLRSIAANPGKPIPDNIPDEIEQREIAAMWDAGGRMIW